MTYSSFSIVGNPVIELALVIGQQVGGRALPLQLDTSFPSSAQGGNESWRNRVRDTFDGIFPEGTWLRRYLSITVPENIIYAAMIMARYSPRDPVSWVSLRAACFLLSLPIPMDLIKQVVASRLLNQNAIRIIGPRDYIQE